MSNIYTTQKALKISTALYMITDIMSEKEPLKWHLRSCAVNLLEANERNICETIERTLDILIIARIARAVSPMNADVLEEELNNLLKVACGERGIVKDDNQPLFGKDFFDVKSRLPAVGENTVEDKVEDIKKEEIVFEVEVKKTVDVKPSLIIDDEDDIESKVERPATTLIPQGIRSAFMPRVALVEDDIIERTARSNDTKSGRREIILTTIREKNNCSIKDIATKLPAVSEKTIQRELVAMTEEGILIKEGDRRWSTYRIATRG